MAEAAKAPKKLKGGRKGGTRFPNINLQKALEYAKKLVSKTHNGPQPEQTILVGVFNNKGPIGQVRASALKQYSLMDGDAKGYVASPLAREIEAALPEQQARLRQRAFLASKLFKQVYDTLQSETASRARVRQVVVTEEVHPDLADTCVTCFIEGAVHCGLGIMEGENIILAKAGTVPPLMVDPDPAADSQGAEGLDEYGEKAEQEQEQGAAASSPAANDSGGKSQANSINAPSAVRVNLTVDSSSDPDKLEKQLRLLKQYGLLRS